MFYLLLLINLCIVYIYFYMLAIAGQKAGQNFMTFFERVDKGWKKNLFKFGYFFLSNFEFFAVFLKFHGYFG